MLSGIMPATDTKRATLSIPDVARMLGVSNMTVSRVINDLPGVGPATRERIQAFLRENDFMPNASARALKSGRSRSLGYLTLASEMRGPMMDTLLALQRAAGNAGYSVTVVSLDEIKEETVLSGRAQLMANSVAAVVVVSPENSSAPALQLLARHVPTVGIWTPADGIPAIAAPDNERGAEIATRHLIELGHERIGHISGIADWMGTDHRLLGWRTVLKKAKLPTDAVVEGAWTAKSGFDAMIRLWETHRPTAIFAASDTMALGAISAAHQLKLRVPQDLSVVGYDDLPEAAFYTPPLTTIVQDFAHVGERAFDAVRVLLGDVEVDEAKPVIEPQLVVRQTTAAPLR
jgi:DNA-binding LacI/PurR family transcriptional regulator